MNKAGAAKSVCKPLDAGEPLELPKASCGPEANPARLEPPQALSFMLGTIGIGGISRLSPPTPPYIRVRIRRFAGLSADGLFCVRARGSDSGLRRVSFGPFERRRPGFTLSRRPKASDLDFSRMAGSRIPHPNVFPAFRPSAKLVPPTMPSADFSVAITNLAARSVRSPRHAGDLPR